MKKGPVFFRYFKTLKTVVIVESILALAVLLLCLINPSWQRYAVLSFLGMLGLCSAINVRKAVYCFRVSREYRRGEIVEAVVVVREIKADRVNNFYNRGGALEGGEKAILCGTDGRAYRFMGESGATATGILAGKKLHVVYFPRTAFLLSVKPDWNGANQKYISFSKMYFSSYLKSIKDNRPADKGYASPKI